MVNYTSLYEANFTNAELTSGSSAFFLSTNDNRQATSLHQQSFNSAEIINDSDQTLTIDLDGLSTRRRTLFGKSVLIINPEDNLFFNTIKITNSGSGTASADKIRGISRIMRLAPTPTI